MSGWFELLGEPDQEGGEARAEHHEGVEGGEEGDPGEGDAGGDIEAGTRGPG